MFTDHCAVVTMPDAQGSTYWAVDGKTEAHCVSGQTGGGKQMSLFVHSVFSEPLLCTRPVLGAGAAMDKAEI